MQFTSGFAVDTKAFDVLSDEKGAVSGFVVHVGKIDLKIQAAENKEADKRTSTVLLVWLAKNANEIAELLKRHGSTFEGEIEVNIFPLTGFEDAVGSLFPYGGLTLEEFKAQVIKNGIKPMLGHPNMIYIVVRDDLENEYFKDTNSMEQMVFGIVIFSLLLLLCGVNERTATQVSVKFASTLIPLKPKLPTHALAMALIGAKRNK